MNSNADLRGIDLNEFPNVQYTTTADGSVVPDYVYGGNLFASMSQAAAKLIMDATDSDRDGAVDASFLSACGITSFTPNKNDVHACFDADGNGFIDPAEFMERFVPNAWSGGGVWSERARALGSDQASGGQQASPPPGGSVVPCVQQSNCMKSGSSCMESTADLRCEKAYTGFFVTDEGRVQPCVEQAGCLTACSDCVRTNENRDLLICHNLLPGYWHDDDGVVHENECNVWPFPVGVVGKSYVGLPRLESDESDPCYGVGRVNGPTVLKAVTDTECWLQCDAGYHPVYLHKDHYHWYHGDEGEDLSRPLTCGMVDGSEATTTLKCAKVESDGHGKHHGGKHHDGKHHGGKHHGGKHHAHDTYDESMQGSMANAIGGRDGNAPLVTLVSAISGFVAAVLVVVALTVLSDKHSASLIQV